MLANPTSSPQHMRQWRIDVINPRFAFCDDLDSPTLCIIMDTRWFADWLETGGREWLADRGADASTGLLIMSEEAKVEFQLRWGTA